MELRKKNRRVFGDFTGDNGKSYFPSRKLRIKTQIVFFCPEISLRLPGLFGDSGWRTPSIFLYTDRVLVSVAFPDPTFPLPILSPNS